MKLSVITQAAIKIEDSKTIYFDPYKITDAPHDATYIFITHDHYDHYDEESLRNVINENTTLIVPTCLQDKARTITNKVLVVDPNNTYELSDISFKTIPAYNLTKPFHPQEKGYVGYLVTSDNTTYYIMGDTDVVEEITNINTDICFVPIGGTYTMDVNEAITYINNLKSKKVIPIHYGSIVGDITLGNEFKEKINQDIEVEILIK